ncbi:dsDNA nuclease domain-containing protein [Spirosoma endophyticum]|uniref:CD-NTase associated protein 4-like DNA endonuclease domain-containing protein n=1 Tax=Spirosoma endophyticum TaxID=662367 RepID=A0A1I2FC59_9BACT|nr:dsDNA nuclease domain-containing protein [Spirosoma endophyticum]SFF02126.1 protein of unknown function [Spirosoma endophyticum]
MNAIQKALIEKKPAEKGGAIAEERFGYQKDWAICKLLELHKSENDYLMIFEYHDDIVVLDSCDNPGLVSFYQIKTKSSGNWTTKNLLDKRKKLNSYLGKLFLNKLNFPEFESTLNFVSNARYSIELNNSSHKSLDFPKICVTDLSNSELNYINSNLCSELSKDKLEIVDTFFHVSTIPIQNSEASSISALVDYFEKFTSDEGIPRIQPLHETLINEIRRKSKYTYEVSSFEELMKYRSFSRSEFHDILMLALKKSNIDLRKIQEMIINRLNSENASIKNIQYFSKNSNQYIIDKLNIMNLLLKKLEKGVNEIISTMSDNDFDQALLPCAEMIYEKLINKYTLGNTLEKSYIMTVILFQIYGTFEL